MSPTNIEQPPAVPTHPIYEVLHEIGSGASAVVFEGYDLRFEQHVAIKELKKTANAEEADSFFEEGKFLRGFSHENIVRVHDIDRDRGWIVMELMQGSLEQKLEGGALGTSDVRDILRQILCGLQQIHASGKLHGEIKPGNVLIDDSGTVKLCDTAGVAANGEFRKPDDSQRHVAPELLNPHEFGVPGQGVDLYCVGLVVLELLTGTKFETLFKGIGRTSIGQTRAWAQWHASPGETLPPVKLVVRGMPDDLAPVVDRLLKKHVSERYASADEALADLAHPTLPSPNLTETAAANLDADGPTSKGKQAVHPPSLWPKNAGSAEAQQNNTQDWRELLVAPPWLKNKLASRYTLLVVGAAFGLLLCLAGAGGAPKADMATVQFDVVNTDGDLLDANINIDGDPLARAGESITVPAGSYELTISPVAKTRYEPHRETIELAAGESAQRIVLQPRIARKAPKSISVVISPRPERSTTEAIQSRISIDEMRAAKGRTQFDLLPGEHRVRVDLDGHEPYEEVILVSPSQTVFSPALRLLRRAVKLIVEPADAQVFLDGEPLDGQAPFQVQVPNGTHELVAEREGYERQKEQLNIEADGVRKFILQPLPRFNVRFETEPRGATLLVDGDRIGTTPIRVALHRGPHDIVLTQPGLTPIQSTEDVQREGEVMFWYLQPDATTTESLP